MSAKVHAPLVALVDRQWGVVSRRQLLALGVASGTISAWLAAGRLRPLHRGVYAYGHARLRAEGRWMAAVLACGPRAALAGRSAAAALWSPAVRERHCPCRHRTGAAPQTGHPPPPHSLPRCPGRHERRRHPDHHHRPYRPRPRGDRAAPPRRALPRPGRPPAALRPARPRGRDRPPRRPPWCRRADQARRRRPAAHPQRPRGPAARGHPRAWPDAAHRPPDPPAARRGDHRRLLRPRRPPGHRGRQLEAPPLASVVRGRPSPRPRAGRARPPDRSHHQPPCPEALDLVERLLA